MNYPLISEYVEAIKAADDNFEQLKHLRPVLGEDGEPVLTIGNFAVVFKMKDEQTGKSHAVKCFLKEQEGRAEAYRQIAEELEYVNSTFLTPIKYLDKELFVDSKNSSETEFPVLLMDWVEGQTLDKYIRKHIDDQDELSLLAYQFSRLAMWLMPQPFAHGDLKPDNILVKEDSTLVLVDYDGMYVPAMKGQNARELGCPDFRHPGRTEEVFDEHIDDFSLASILLSLKAIALQPTLLEEYGASDRLLFSEKDYRYLSESKVMDALKPLMQDAELASLYSLFILAVSYNNLSRDSSRFFNLNRPERSQYEVAFLPADNSLVRKKSNTYKIGFYYGLETGRGRHNNRLVLVFDNDHLEFRAVSPNIVENLGRYSLEFPIIYSEDNKINDIRFLKDLPIVQSPNQEEGFCITRPNRNINSAKLYYNGIDIFNTEDTSLSEIERDFYNSVVYYGAVLTEISFLDSNISPFMDFHKKAINQKVEYVESIDITSIVSDLQVSVYEVLKSRPGKDDYYYIYRDAMVSSPIASSDKYLCELIGIGDNCIYEDSGFTSCERLSLYAEDFKKTHPIGIYVDDMLEKEKQRIVSNYSKEKHIAYLIAEYFINKERNRQFILPELQSGLKEIKEKLFKDYHLSEISNEKREFESYVYPLESDKIDVEQEIEKLNTHVKEITKCESNRKHSPLEDFDWDSYEREKNNKHE